MSAVLELQQLIPQAREADTIEPALPEYQDPQTDGFDVAPMPTDEQQEQTRGMVKMLLDTSFGLLAPNWEVEQHETEELTAALMPVLDKYLPNIGSKIGCEFVLLSTVAMVALPRIQAGIPARKERELNPREKGVQQDAEPREAPVAPQEVPTAINLD